MQPDPRTEYSQRLEARRTSAAAHYRRHIQFGNLRLLIFAAAAVIAWQAWTGGNVSGWWLLAPLAAFVALMVAHERVLRAQRRCERAAAFYERGLARLDGRWIGKGESGERFRDPEHPYAEDLDLFGKGSVFDLLCTARTRAGEETLAAWLKAAAPPAAVQARQAAVAELRPRLDLREDLALLGENIRKSIHSEVLAAWSEGEPLLDSQRDRIAAAVLPVLLGLGWLAWQNWDLRPLFLLALAGQAVFAFRLRPRVSRSAAAVEHPAHDLALLSSVLERIEREAFTAPRLVELRAALETGGRPASHRIARLNRLIELLDSRDNVAMRIIGPLLLWTTQLAFAIEAWRKNSGPAVRGWLAAAGEIEALAALAGYAFENPGDPFPEFVDAGPLFDGEGLTHPLLGSGRAVPNDVSLGAGLNVLIVSGSNMSGKSTLLRTVGVNAVLAQAGAPVRARRLRLSPLAVGASIRVTDSLQGGSSRFYAEITRVRAIVDLSRGPVPALFLLDELLHGTNSHDRRIGATAVVSGLAARGAIGLITTHDLALADIAESLGERGANVHFEDHLEGGTMHFDYIMRPGVVRKSNALELMRSVGLEV